MVTGEEWNDLRDDTEADWRTVGADNLSLGNVEADVKIRRALRENEGSEEKVGRAERWGIVLMLLLLG